MAENCTVPPAHCHHCGGVTPTVYRLLSSGHVGNLCATCGTARLGRPYVSRDFLTTTPRPRQAVEGAHHASRTR